MTVKFTWRNDPENFIGHLQRVSKDRTLEVAKKIFDGVVSRTPVYTGSLRASWRVSAGPPDRSYVTHKDPNNPLPPPSFSLTVIPLYARVYITNTTPYVNLIEFGGWSKEKAPYGMVRVTLASLGVSMGVRR